MVAPKGPKKILSDAEKDAAKAKRNAERVATLKKLAPARVGRAVTAIRLVGNLGAYNPTPAQSQAIAAKLGDALKQAVAQFQAGGKKTEESFTLPD